MKVLFIFCLFFVLSKNSTAQTVANPNSAKLIEVTENTPIEKPVALLQNAKSVEQSQNNNSNTTLDSTLFVLPKKVYDPQTMDSKPE